MRRKKRNWNKVFGIGLSKTGTTSLNRALQILGLNSVHKYHHRPKNSDQPRQVIEPQEIGRYDAVTDIGASGRFEALDNTFPGSLFVYTVRELEAWLRSIYVQMYGSHYWEGRRPDIMNDPATNASRGHYEMWCDTYGMHNALYFQRHIWILRYIQHAERVHRYFQCQKSKLLVMNICAGDGYEKLCPFLGLPIPKDRIFPHEKNAGYGYPWVESKHKFYDKTEGKIPDGLLY